MKYKKLTGIVLKKTNYRESDQIIAIWTKELGKVRFLAKGVRKSSSKLVYNLQDFALVSLEAAGKNLPVLIGVQTVKSFKNLRTDLHKLAASCYAAELMLKMTADEQPNSKAFELLVEFLDKLDRFSGNLQQEVSYFSLELIKILGFGYKTTEPDLNFTQVNAILEELLERNLKSKAFIYDINELEFPSPSRGGTKGGVGKATLSHLSPDQLPAAGEGGNFSPARRGEI